MRPLYLLYALLCFSCSTVKKTPAPSLDLYSAAQEWPVKINDGWLSAKTISYGSYATTSRRNGISSAANISFVKAAENAFNFNVKDSTEQILVQALNTPAVTFQAVPYQNPWLSCRAALRSFIRLLTAYSMLHWYAGS